MIFLKKPLKLNFQLNFDRGREREETKIYLLQKKFVFRVKNVTIFGKIVTENLGTYTEKGGCFFKNTLLLSVIFLFLIMPMILVLHVLLRIP